MATLGNITELRTIPQLIQLEDVAVNADEQIIEITGTIENNGITLVSGQVVFENAGKLYVETPSGKKHYLTDSSQDYPAMMQILFSYFVPRGVSLPLKFSVNTTMTGCIIVSSGGVF